MTVLVTGNTGFHGHRHGLNDHILLPHISVTGLARDIRRPVSGVAEENKIRKHVHGSRGRHWASVGKAGLVRMAQLAGAHVGIAGALTCFSGGVAVCAIQLQGRMPLVAEGDFCL